MPSPTTATASLSLLLVGRDRKLRPIFRALIYAALAFWLLSADEFLGPPLQRAASALHATGLSPGTGAFYETINLLTALLLTWLFGRYEGRRVDDYGLPIRQAFRSRYWEGFAIGVAAAAAVALGMIALGGMTVHGLALHGGMLGCARLAGVECARRHRRGIPLSRLPAADAVEEPRLLARGGAHRPVVRSRSLLLQARRERMGSHLSRLIRYLDLLHRPANRVAMACRWLPRRIRLHAALRHRHTQRERGSRQPPVECVLPGTGLGHRRCPRHGGELSLIPGHRLDVRLH